MTRLGWLILGLLLLPLLAYVFWPAAAQRTLRPLVEPGSDPVAFTLRLPGLEQTVTASGQVLLTAQGVTLERPLDANRPRSFWSTLRQCQSAESRTVQRPEDLAAFGLDGTRSVRYGSREFRWGSAAGRAYAWRSEDGLLLVLPPIMLQRLDEAGQRFDDRRLLQPGSGPRRIRVAERHFVLSEDGWQDESAPQRPPFDTRLGHLGGLLSQLRLDDLVGVPATGAGISIELEEAERTQRLTLLPWQQTLAAHCDGLPAQVLPRQLASAFQELIADLDEDILLSIQDQTAQEHLPGTVTIHDGSSETLRLERTARGGGRTVGVWEVIWSGGRELADPAAASTLVALANSIRITAPRRQAVPRLAILGDNSAVRTVQFDGNAFGGHHLLRLDGQEAASFTHAGTATGVQAIRDLRVEDLLDLRLLPVDLQRFMRLQTVEYSGSASRGTLLLRGAGGWARVVPDPGPVAAPTVEARLTLLVAWQASKARFPLAADLLRPVERSVAVRLAPVDSKPGEDVDSLDDVAERDWGLDFGRLANGNWWALAADRSRVWTVSHQTVEDLFAPIDGGTVLPAMPSAVRAVTLEPGSTGAWWSLRRSGETWLLAGAAVERADATQAARLLRTLTGLTGTLHPDGVVDEKQAVACFVVELPSHDQWPEVHRLFLGAAEADGGGLVQVRRDHGLDPVTRRVFRIDAAARAELLRWVPVTALAAAP
jgi:hypothetical protein